MQPIFSKVKNWFLDLFSFNRHKLKLIGSYSFDKYGIAISSSAKVRNAKEIGFDFARHSIDNQSLQDLEKLLAKEINIKPSIQLSDKIKKSKGDNIEELMKDAKSELLAHKVLSKKDNRTAQNLYALAYIMADKGAIIQVEDAHAQGYRKCITVYVDDNCQDPAKVIRMALKGIGIKNENYIKDAINKFYKKDPVAHDIPTYTFLNSDKAQNKSQPRTESKMGGQQRKLSGGGVDSSNSEEIHSIQGDEVLWDAAKTTLDKDQRGRSSNRKELNLSEIETVKGSQDKIRDLPPNEFRNIYENITEKNLENLLNIVKKDNPESSCAYDAEKIRRPEDAQDPDKQYKIGKAGKVK